jgi:hypothetical protein
MLRAWLKGMRLQEEVRGELQGGGDVGGEVLVVVAAGVEMELVGDVAGGKDFVESGGAGFEAVVVLIAAIEINFQAREIGGAGKGEWAVLLPEGGVERTAEDFAEDAIARSGRSGGGDGGRDFIDERGAVRADGSKKLRMVEGQVERAVAAHGDSIDGAIGAAGCDSIAVFDEGEKFLEHEIFVAILAVSGVDVEAGARIGSGDQKIREFVFVAHVFNDIPEAGVDYELFVVAEAVEEVEDREMLGFLGVEGSRENDAVGDGAGEDFAGDGIAFDAAGGSGENGGKKNKEKQDERAIGS